MANCELWGGSYTAQYESSRFRATINSRFDGTEASWKRILFAVESSSRAWEFPSPDGDYNFLLRL